MPITKGNARIEDVIPGRKWRLTEAMIYAFSAEETGEPCVITVPAGFVFDLASIPTALGFCLQKTSLSIDAPVLHDFLYQLRGVAPFDCVTPWRTFTRAEVDRIFRLLMVEEGVPRHKAWTAYLAVRALGWIGWNA